eukprot:TRINITY_DN5311_c0_g1_i1.p1 TRINITY_DN5311_c0_g1~~TRINITY_DN5311_c0_g1_i1.p1  ORF type:complete len:415 (+),score=80.59 TRINITY_DN5311_c0_g1_i1:73-1317(+)
MGSHMSVDMVNDSKRLFEILDTEKKGHLTHAELRDFARRSNPSNDTKTLNRVLEKIDNDGNDEIDQMEFMQYLDEEFAIPFQRADTTKAGYLNRGQMKNALSYRGIKLSDSQYRKFLIAAKLDGDEVRPITFQRFVLACMDGAPAVVEAAVDSESGSESESGSDLDASLAQSRNSPPKTDLAQSAGFPTPASPRSTLLEHELFQKKGYQRLSSPCFASKTPRFQKARSQRLGPGTYEYWKTDEISSSTRDRSTSSMFRSKTKRWDPVPPPPKPRDADWDVDKLIKLYQQQMKRRDLQQPQIPHPTSSFVSTTPRLSRSRASTPRDLGPGSYEPEVYRPRSASIAPFAPTTNKNTTRFVRPTAQVRNTNAAHRAPSPPKKTQTSPQLSFQIRELPKAPTADAPKGKQTAPTQGNV